jgi:MFS family permease
MLIVAGTLFAIPYGLLADRYGRLSAIHLTIPGFIINGIITNSVLWFSDVFPLRGIWIAALSWTLGGGPVVAFTLIWTMIADATTESERATVFFRFGVMSMIADFLSNALSSALMTLNPWIPLILGNTIIILGLSLTVSLPETLDVLPPRTQAEEFNIELSNVNAFTDPRMDRIPSHPSWPLQNPACLSSLQDKLRRTIAPYSFIFTRPVLQLLSVFLIYEMSQGSSRFLVQYISTRFTWSLAHANLLVSLQPAISIPVFLFVLPYLSQRLLRYLSPPALKDLYLAQISIVCLTLGMLGISLCPSIIILIPSLALRAVGLGLLFLVRSLITVLVRRDETARLYAVIGVLTSVGSMMATLCMTNVFTFGLEKGGAWTGLAWMMTSLLLSIVGVIVWTFRLPEGVREEEKQ